MGVLERQNSDEVKGRWGTRLRMSFSAITRKVNNSKHVRAYAAMDISLEWLSVAFRQKQRYQEDPEVAKTGARIYASLGSAMHKRDTAIWSLWGMVPLESSRGYFMLVSKHKKRRYLLFHEHSTSSATLKGRWRNWGSFWRRKRVRFRDVHFFWAMGTYNKKQLAGNQPMSRSMTHLQY